MLVSACSAGLQMKAARGDAGSLREGSRTAYSVRTTFLLKRSFSALKVQK